MKRLGFLLLLALGVTNIVFLQSVTIEQLPRLKATQPAGWQIDAATQNISSMRWQEGLELAGNSREAKVRSFLSAYGSDLGLKASTSNFTVVKETRDHSGNHHLKMSQLYRDVPVFDGHLTFHFDKHDQLQSLSGVVLPAIELEVSDPIQKSVAVEQAQQWLQKHYPTTNADVVVNDLYVYQEGLVQNTPGEIKLVYYVELANKLDIREYLIIDAESGQVIERFPGICTLIDRTVYLENLNNNIWTEGDVFPAALDSWQQTEVIGTEEFYNLFKNVFQYTSYDNNDSEMRIIDQASFIDCPNASWNGYSTNYCDFIGADDVVGHEWAHAYTEYTSNLILGWQAGAINEAYSDIWGETIDLLNGDADALELRTDCDNSMRWKLAEATGSLPGPLRDLYDPNCHDDPGKVSDPLYDCSTNDHGGIHSNAGVISHAYALLVDGGTYNGYTIEGIGLTKAAHIFWQTQRYYLSRTSDFSAMANGLEAACESLRGVPLMELSLTMDGEGFSEELIDATDSLALSQVIAATELRLNITPCSEYSTALAQYPEDFCNENGLSFYPFYIESFEQSIEGWTTSELPENESTWVARQWQLSSALPDNRSGKGMHGPDPNVGSCVLQQNNGIIRLESPLVVVPDELEGRVYLNFDHYFSMEEGMDGGNIKVQQDGGEWRKIPPSAFLYNGYNTSLPVSSSTNNPMAAEWVFSGADEGSVTGTWGTSQIDLTIIGVREGDEISIRWEVGTDGCGGWDGWYIDNVQIGTCGSAPLLPVEWLSFAVNATANGAALTWTTAREENNAGFAIERSTDGRTFSDIGWVDGLGYSESPTDYQYTDGNLPAGTERLYYRLRQEDESGEIDYSPIRELRLDQPTSWQVVPNPARDHLRINWQGQVPADLSLRLYDLQGKEVMSLPNWNPNATATLAVNQLPAGVYLLQLVGEGYYEMGRVVLE